MPFLGSQRELLFSSFELISFLRWQLINHGTPLRLTAIQSNPIAPGYARNAWLFYSIGRSGGSKVSLVQDYGRYCRHRRSSRGPGLGLRPLGAAHDGRTG